MIVLTRSARWAVGAAATSAALAAALAIPIATQSPGTMAKAATSTVLATFAKHGFATWTVPTGTTTVTFTVFGASGSGASSGSVLLSAGGPGGEARGQFRVQGGEVFEVVVGGQGTGSGGFNGGGNPVDPSMGGGGGGSDVRIGGLSDPCGQGKDCDFANRIVVGGGGGGGGLNGNGGAGGGAQGATGGGAEGGAGGSQNDILFSACGLASGVFGCGGWAKANTSRTHAGAGGGGWSGGDSAFSDGGGGGGSGYVSPLALSGSFPGGTRAGDGKVVISTP